MKSRIRITPTNNLNANTIIDDRRIYTLILDENERLVFKDKNGKIRKDMLKLVSLSEDSIMIYNVQYKILHRLTKERFN